MHRHRRADAYRTTGSEHTNLHSGRSTATNAGGTQWRVAHWRGGTSARVFQSSRPDLRAIHSASFLKRTGSASLSDRGSGALSAGWEYRVPGPVGPAGEVAGLPH